jgi:hypothetical protein
MDTHIGHGRTIVYPSKRKSNLAQPAADLATINQDLAVGAAQLPIDL